jgi:hypothetical protein
MRNINKILLVVIIVLLVALVGIVAWKMWGGTPSYYAVYLKTGDLYFGQLSRFPSFGLSHIYLLQVNSQNQQNPVNVQKFSNVFWGPEDFIKINREEVVWYSKLRNDSQLVRLIESNPELAPSQASPQPSQPSGTNPSNEPAPKSNGGSSGSNTK